MTRVLALLVALAAPSSATIQTNRFVIISAPRLAKVSYFRVGSLKSSSSSGPQDLITGGLRHPQGLAVDQARKMLYIADPDDSKILKYKLSAGSNGDLTATDPVVVSDGVESRWVAVDSSGSYFFTDEPFHRIFKVGVNVRGGVPTPEVVYDGNSISAVSAPGGIAVDNFFLYWTNKQIGNTVGSLIRGAETPSKTNPVDSVGVLARNTQKSYGVCLAMDNVYYTDATQKLYAVKKSGSAPVEVSNKFTQPRGCAWDGDGTVYVADRGANKVYSFAGDMEALSLAQVDEALDFEDAFGVAVFSGAAGRGLLAGIGLAIAAAVAQC